MPALHSALSPADLATVRTLFQEYATALGVDLSFQGFETELLTLPGAYAPPGGILILATEGPATLGCVAVRPLETHVAEMKRLYVRPEARKLGLGRSLAEGAISFARGAGYNRIRLDTLPSMVRAHELYASLGFQTIPPYRENPISGTTYLELALI